MHSFLWAWSVVTGIVVCIASQNNFRQERAEVKYFNTKYLKNAQAFTARQRRGEPYKTNLTATTIHPWANNVTMEMSYKSKISPTPFIITVKMCDMVKSKWMIDFVKSYSDIPLICPIAPGTYNFINVELPPKNFPLPILKGNVQVKFTHYITDTKEVVVVTTVGLNID